MITRIKEDNRNLKIVTQQYGLGFDVAIYDDDSNVFIGRLNIRYSEERYHKQLREKYKDSLID